MLILPVLAGKYGLQVHVEVGRWILPWHRYWTGGAFRSDKILPQKIHSLGVRPAGNDLCWRMNNCIGFMSLYSHLSVPSFKPSAVAQRHPHITTGDTPG